MNIFLEYECKLLKLNKYFLLNFETNRQPYSGLRIMRSVPVLFNYTVPENAYNTFVPCFRRERRFVWKFVPKAIIFHLIFEKKIFLHKTVFFFFCFPSVQNVLPFYFTIKTRLSFLIFSFLASILCVQRYGTFMFSLYA
jgi:hypothetical protein